LPYLLEFGRGKGRGKKRRKHFGNDIACFNFVSCVDHEEARR